MANLIESLISKVDKLTVLVNSIISKAKATGELPEASLPLDDQDLIRVVQNGQSYKTGVSNFKSAAAGGLATDWNETDNSSLAYLFNKPTRLSDFINDLATGGDMTKAVYDTNNNGIVDNAQLVNGLTVLTAVPAGALFTDTIYDDSLLSTRVSSAESAINTLSTSKLSSIVAGTNVTIDNTDPVNPIINVTGGPGGTSDHGALTGLGDDDHPQYHDDTRGDARYSQLAHTHVISDITDIADLLAIIAIAKLTEGGNTGYIVSGADRTEVASDIGQNAMDFCAYNVSHILPEVGITGRNSFGVGLNNFASGINSFVGGGENEASGESSFVMGYSNKATAWVRLLLDI